MANISIHHGAQVNQDGGTWSNFTFGSGIVVASTIDGGLFVLRPDLPDSPNRGR